MVVAPVSIITRVLSYIRLQSVVLTWLGYSPNQSSIALSTPMTPTD